MMLERKLLDKGLNLVIDVICTMSFSDSTMPISINTHINSCSPNDIKITL